MLILSFNPVFKSRKLFLESGCINNLVHITAYIEFLQWVLDQDGGYTDTIKQDANPRSFQKMPKEEQIHEWKKYNHICILV